MFLDDFQNVLRLGSTAELVWDKRIKNLRFDLLCNVIGLSTHTFRRVHSQRVRTAHETFVERSLKFVSLSLSLSLSLVRLFVFALSYIRVMYSFQICFQLVTSSQASIITVVGFSGVCVCVCVSLMARSPNSLIQSVKGS